MPQELLSPYRRLYRLILPEKKDVFSLYLFAFIGGLVSLVLPLGIQSVISFTATGNLIASWWVLVVVVTAATLFVGIVKIIQMVIIEIMQQRIFAKAALEFAYRLPRLVVEEDAISPASDSNKFFDVLTLQKSLPKILIEITTTFFEIILALLLLSTYHHIFAMFSLFIILGTFTLVKLFMGPSLNSSLLESKEKYKLVEYLQKIDLRNKPAEGDMEMVDNQTSKYLEARKQHFSMLKYQSIVAVILKAFITTGLLLLGGSLVVSNAINLGEFVAAEIIIIMVLSGIEKFIISLESVYDALTAVEKLGQITDKELLEK